MQIQKRDDLDVVIRRLVPDPVGESQRFDAFKRLLTRKGLGTRIARRVLAAPLEAKRTIEVEALAEAQVRLLSVLTPQAVRLPCVNVAVRVEGGDKHPVKVLDELRHRFGFSVGGDEAVSDIIDRAGADPLASVGATGDDDGLAWSEGVLDISRVDTDADGGDGTALVGKAEREERDMGSEEGGEKGEPRRYDGKGLICLEEDILGGRGVRRWR